MGDFLKLLVLVLLSLVTDALGQTTNLPTTEPADTDKPTVSPTDSFTTVLPTVPTTIVLPTTTEPADTDKPTVFPTGSTTIVFPTGSTTIVPDTSTAGPDSSTAGPDSSTAGPDSSTAGPDSSTAVTAPALEETTAYELDTAGITLNCGNDSMTVQIPTRLLTVGADGGDLMFANSNSTCLGEAKTTDFIILNTKLTECGTERSEDDTHEVYSNMVVNSEIGTISRQYKVEIPINCSYSRSGRVSQAWYQLTDYVLDKDLEEDGEYSFDLKFYGDSDFTQPIDGFPYLVDLDEELYFAASLGSEEYNDLDLSIKSCKATHGEEYDGAQQYDLITGWEVADEETAKTSISCFSKTDDSNTDTIRVTTHAFRFIDLGGDQNGVYIHCDLFVCAESEDDSQCKDQCTKNPDSRRKRDVSFNSPPLPIQRLTRGPIRFRRAAHAFNAPEQMEIPNEDNPGAQVSTPLTMWALIMVIMGSVVIVLLAALVVTLRKLVTTKSTTIRKDDEADVGLINDNESD